jgi:hypothetical protein
VSEYQGHKNRNHWNVALWIGNDEGLYNLAKQCMRDTKTKDEAAREILNVLRVAGVTHTPDGKPYSYSAIRAALVGLS